MFVGTKCMVKSQASCAVNNSQVNSGRRHIDDRIDEHQQMSLRIFRSMLFIGECRRARPHAPRCKLSIDRMQPDILLSIITRRERSLSRNGGARNPLSIAIQFARYLQIIWRETCVRWHPKSALAATSTAFHLPRRLTPMTQSIPSFAELMKFVRQWSNYSAMLFRRIAVGNIIIII